jgi:hypothetical protein
MDWDLPLMDSEIRDKIARKQEELIGFINSIPDMVGDSVQELLQRLLPAFTLPAEALLALADEIATAAEGFDVLISDHAAVDSDGEQAREHLRTLAGCLTKLFFCLLRKAAGQADSDRAMNIQVELPRDVETQLASIKQVLSGFPGPRGNLDAVSCIWFLLSERLPIVAGKFRTAPAGAKLAAAKYPILWSVLSLIPLLPGADDTGSLVKATVTIEPGKLRLKIEIG